MRKTCSKLTIKAPWWHQWRRFDVLIVNFEQIYHIVLVFSLLTLNMWMRLTSYWNRWYLLLTLSKFVCIASLSLLPSLFFFSIGSLEGLCFNFFVVNCQIYWCCLGYQRCNNITHMTRWRKFGLFKSTGGHITCLESNGWIYWN